MTSGKMNESVTRDIFYFVLFIKVDLFIFYLFMVYEEKASVGKTTYVHCKAGRGRSTTVVLCYLVHF